MTPLDPSIALVLLAAGRSKRFGKDKLIADFNGKPLWEWSAKAAEAAGFQTRYLLVAEHSSAGARSGWQRVINLQADCGVGTSIAAGIAAASACRRVIFALADMPYMEAAHLRCLADLSGPVFTRQADGGAGTPAAFDRSDFASLRGLDNDSGARSLNIPGAKIIEPSNKKLLLDVDRPSDLPLAR